MNAILKYTILTIIALVVVGGLAYKAMSPNDYQDPRYRSSK